MVVIVLEARFDFLWGNRVCKIWWCDFKLLGIIFFPLFLDYKVINDN